MKFRILYQSAEPLSARTLEGAQKQCAARSDDLDEFALSADFLKAELQYSTDGKTWTTVETING